MLTFRNDVAELRPLALAHVEPLAAIAFEPAIWALGTVRLRHVDELNAYVDDAVADRRAGEAYPFAVFDTASGRIAGCTRLINFSWRHRRLEIGHSWLGEHFRGTGLNVAAKYELIRFGFEELAFDRVEWKTDTRNAAARRALDKLGAVEEGVLRSHALNWDGHRRDTVFYSVIRPEWPRLKESVFASLAAD